MLSRFLKLILTAITVHTDQLWVACRNLSTTCKLSVASTRIYTDFRYTKRSIPVLLVKLVAFLSMNEKN